MITTIICTYNRATILASTLSSLAQMQIPEDFSWELIVVDNNSDDSTAKVVEHFSKASRLPLRYVLERTQGHTHARNTGIQNAQGDIILFTDDDVIVAKSWLVQVAKVFQEYKCMAAGGKVIPVWPGRKPRWFYDEGPYNLSGAIVQFDLGDKTTITKTAPYGANMAFAKEAFVKYGLFRCDLGRVKDVLMSGDDTEMFHRLIRAGEDVVYMPEAVVYHPVGLERMRKSYFQSWFFQFGRYEVRVGPPCHAVRCFGVPRYLVREMAESFLRWLLAVRPTKRFYEKVQLYRYAGMIAESRRSFERAVASQE